MIYAIAQQNGVDLPGYPNNGSAAASSDNSDGESDDANQDDCEDSLDESDSMGSRPNALASLGDNCSMLKEVNDDGHFYTHALSGTFLSQNSLKWLENKIDDPALFERLRASIQSLFVQQQHRLHLYSENILNPMALDLEFLRSALRYFAAANIPFINVLLTPREAEEYSKSKWDALSLSDRFLACSATSLMAFWMGRDEVSMDLKYSQEYLQRQSRLFMSHAGKYAQTLTLAVPSTAKIRGYAMFVMALDKLQMPPATSFYSMLTMNLAMIMGMNRTETYRGMSEEAKERRKIVWWLVYVLERDMAIKMGRPPMIPDSEISVEMLDRREGNIQNVCISNFIHLARIYSKVYRKLFAVPAQTKSRSQHFLDIISLSHELDAWKEKLPPNLQITENGDFVTDSNSISDMTTKKLVIWIHTCYYEVSTTIHRIPAFSTSAVQAFLKRQQDPNRAAASASQPSGSTPTEISLSDEDMAILLNARDVCRDGARQILRCAKHISAVGCGSLVSGSILFLTSAFITLFATNMTDPLGPSSIADRELMQEYVPLFSMQKLDYMYGQHPVSEFWSVIVEILHRYQIQAARGDSDELKEEGKPDAEVTPPVAPINNHPNVPPYPGFSSSDPNSLRPNHQLPHEQANEQQLPAHGQFNSNDPWVHDSILLDPQVEGNVNWLMRDAYDGIFQQPGETNTPNFGELASDMYMMSGFYGV